MIGVVIRINESRNLDRYGVMLTNYITATCLSLGFTDTSRLAADLRGLLPFGAVTGLLYVAGFLAYMRAVKRLGLAVPVTVTRLSVVIPVLGSLLLYSEIVSPVQILGLLLAGLSISLFSLGGDGRRPHAGGSRAWLLLVPVFVLMGSGELSLKVFRETFARPLTSGFILLVFIVASILTAVISLVRRTRIDRNVALGGLALGIPNFFSAVFILKVLGTYPGAIAFPLNNIGVIALSALAGRLFWNERLARNAKIAMAAAVLAVVLLNA